MSLFAALDSAIGSMQVINASVATLADNVANAQNEDYSQTEVIVKDLVNGGVAVGAVRRKVNEGLRTELLNETTAEANNKVIDEIYTFLEQTTGTIASQTPLPDLMNALNSAWKAFEAAPESDAAARDTILQGQALVSELGRISSGLDILASQTLDDIDDTVEQLNNSLNEIARLNGTVVPGAGQLSRFHQP